MRFGLFTRRIPLLGAALCVATLLVTTGLHLAHAKGGAAPSGKPMLVMLTASWCGTCREMMPVVQQVARDNGNIQTLAVDVDGTNAPDLARQYGITVSGGDIPQVYLYHNGQSTLVLNGKGYKYGHARDAEAQMSRALKAAL